MHGVARRAAHLDALSVEHRFEETEIVEAAALAQIFDGPQPGRLGDRLIGRHLVHGVGASRRRQLHRAQVGEHRQGARFPERATGGHRDRFVVGRRSGERRQSQVLERVDRGRRRCAAHQGEILRRQRRILD
ncbi:MAG: hypothetical protein V3T05_03975, partial [Myxococcota bacterium]